MSGIRVTSPADYWDHRQVFNGLDYGCVADGDVEAGTGTDNTTALQKIITESSNSGRAAFLPAGVYRYATTQLTAARGFTLIGEPGTVLFKDHVHHGLFINPAALFTGTVTAQSDNGKVKVTGAAFRVDAYAGHYCQVTSNDSGSVARLQRRKILSNTSDTLTLEYDLAITPASGDAVVIYDTLRGIVIENITVQAGRARGQAGLDISFVDDLRLTNVRSVGHSGDAISINTGRNIRLEDCRGEDSFFGIFVYNGDDVLVTNCAGVNASDAFHIELKDCRNSAIIGGYAEGGPDNSTTSNGLHIHSSGLNPSYNVHVVDGSAFNMPGAGINVLATHEEAAGGTPYDLWNASVSGAVYSNGGTSLGVQFINESGATMRNAHGHALSVVGAAVGISIVANDVEIAGFTIERCTRQSLAGVSADRVKLSNGVVKDGNTSGTSGAEITLSDCTDWTVTNVSAVHTDSTSKSIGFVRELGASDRNQYRDCRVLDTDSAYTTDYFALVGLASQVVNTARTHQRVAYATTVTPDCRLGEIVDIGTLTGNITIGAPTHPNRGLRLTLNTTQDATGGRRITLNRVFKANWTPSTAAGAFNTITFEYAGGYWVQQSAATGLSSGAATVASDTFTRNDSTTSLGVADTGQAWTVLKGTWGISSGKAYNPTADVRPLAVVASGIADGTVQVTISRMAATAGVYFRVVDARNWLRMINNGVGNRAHIVLSKSVAGTIETVATVTGQTVADGDVYKVTMQGTTITMYVNGRQVGTPQTVADFATATQHGIGSDVGSASIRWDDFSVKAP